MRLSEAENIENIENLKSKLCLIQVRRSSTTSTNSTNSNLSFLDIFLVKKSCLFFERDFLTLTLELFRPNSIKSSLKIIMQNQFQMLTSSPSRLTDSQRLRCWPVDQAFGIRHFIQTFQLSVRNCDMVAFQHLSCECETIQNKCAETNPKHLTPSFTIKKISAMC